MYLIFTKYLKRNIDLGYLVIYLLKQIQVIILESLVFNNYKYSMKYLIASKSSRALFGIRIFALSNWLISKKVINYPAGG